MNRAILGTSFGGGRENGGNEPAAERRDEKLDDTSIVVQLVPAVFERSGFEGCLFSKVID